MPLVERAFDREKHVYRDQDLAELLQEAVQFFNGTPVMKFPINPNQARCALGDDRVDEVRDFNGLAVMHLPIANNVIHDGVYALYCQGKVKVAETVEDVNDYGYDIPFYVGRSTCRSNDESDDSVWDTLPIGEQLRLLTSVIPHQYEIAMRCLCSIEKSRGELLYRALKHIYCPMLNDN